MGALHAGHLSLVRRCLAKCDEVVVSIFVNPLQFGPNEDFLKYPRDPDGDVGRLQGIGASLVFTPARDEMYPAATGTTVIPGAAASRWEGAARPGHFAGVLTVVAKLLNIVQPDVATFGRKDFQQALLVRAMVRDLNLPVSIDVAPTVRDEDGLAMSSRNSYLSQDARTRALCIPRALARVRAEWRAGESDARALLGRAAETLGAGVDSIDYLAIADAETLEPLEAPREDAVVLVAARVAGTRLIDNVLLDHAPEPGLDDLWKA
jgi:pantoate--beta-alanine ligase